MRILMLCALGSVWGCGSSREVAGKALVVTGTVLAAAAVVRSGEPVLLSDDVDALLTSPAPRAVYSVADAALITAGAGMVAVGEELSNRPRPPSGPSAPPGFAPVAPSSAAPAAASPTSLAARRVVDPDVIEAACASVLEQTPAQTRAATGDGADDAAAPAVSQR
jgi:hypothetical protein